MADAVIGQLMSMGYEHHDVVNALNAANQDVNLATQYLIDGLPDTKKNKKNNTLNDKPIEQNKSDKIPDDMQKSEKISNLMSMGFECDQVLESLEKYNYDQQRAADDLLRKNTKSDSAMQYLFNKEKNKNKNKNKNKKQGKKNSAYYLYSSTDKQEALKYRPKKIEKIEQKEAVKNKKGSEWNTGATMEQFDYSSWMKQRLKYLLLNHVQIKCDKDTDCIKIHEVVSVDGSATFLLIRNVLRPGYDISFECKWKGEVMVDNEKQKVEGKLCMDEITSEDDPEDWEYDVTVSENVREYRIARNIVKKEVNKQSVLNVLDMFIKEFKAKKQ